MKIFDIASSHGDQFIWSDSPPTGFKDFIIPGAIFHTAEAGVGYMAMQHLQRPGYSIWLSNYRMKQKRKTHVRQAYAALEFSLIIYNNVVYNLAGFGKIEQQEAQFNISNLTDIDSHVLFEADRRYATFDIHCDFDFLQNLSPIYPYVVNPILEDMLAGKRHQVFPRYIYATPYMMNLVASIIQLLSKGNKGDMILDMTVQLLIASALTRKMEMLRPASLKLFDNSDKMNLISNLLIKDLSMFPHVDVLAKKIHMNETTFNKLFKEAFQLNPYQFWTKQRLDKAYDRVVNSGTPLKEIALEIGFGSIQSFSKKFKKRYYKSPSSLRKK